MNVREKLVELMGANTCKHDCCEDCEYREDENACVAYIKDSMADHLISHGVTVQEWISVKDRLPDLIPCNVGTAYSEAVIAWTSGRKAMIAVWDGIDWIAPFDYWEAWGEEITHWMPLPQPPEEGTR